ncbi:hypothetical protein NCCP1664_19470 [Zafaria cholistanensis]|uniref:Uncharacterized protein n=1 Tax=Zafaria cholistanensis TaxID=1682741 RepID=A0A5A7NUI1_9MICC|nr:hypothetical protein [Zafaria cholistanensis]GER23451.1 hypothetical protein NCCP1664_19470 [Zafaria cholistanensis]
MASREKYATRQAATPTVKLATQADLIAWTTRGGGGDTRIGAGAVLDIPGRAGL